ncbi:hypothetical protein DQ238_11475 [Geodermatophilus sp. TF02-6]|uniref:RelA/SpoT domain-containing protein n=1 Tax=Geodermatophilus sp. TF02-6 TaxID=2250575 RepID=UPI000DE9BB2E|nr:RelA/SpoT domain-containing protein [Geodermatophilus sp. TF02-6]RBY78691.1 hypothetical protein DQ238_11475 [Geodermatophilus sp. TF02-6]
MSESPPLQSLIPPVPLPASRSRLARLGERLAAGTLAPGDEELYLAFLDAYDRVQVDLVRALRAVDWREHVSPPLDIVGRTKTRDTLLEKLRRSPEVKLPYIRDVAGVRIVGDMTLTNQRLVTALLIRVFGGRIIDRLAEPQSGYRAMHAAITFAGLPVEIQVRTRAQHVWAEVFERLADRWGRQIRYGGPPDDPRAPGALDDGVSLEARVELVEQLQELSIGWFDHLERTLNDVAAAEAGATDDGPIGEAVRRMSPVRRLPPDEAAKLRERLARITEPARQARRDVEQQLLDLMTSLEDGPLDGPGMDTLEGS